MKFLIPMLETLDEIQSKRGQPLNSRPFDSAVQLVRHVIIEVEGDEDKDDFAEKKWFAAIYAQIHKWYEKRYGPLSSHKEGGPTGLIVHAGLPHTISIPRTIKELQSNGLLKVTFPSKVYEGEKPLDWVHPRIRTKALLEAERKKLRGRLASVTSSMRAIEINTSGAGAADSGIPAMARSIPAHLSKAATTVAPGKEESNSLALWDLHLACEKAIKSVLSQRQIIYGKSHDLGRLNTLLKDSVLESRASRLIRRLPNHKEVMNHRYLEEESISISSLYLFYLIAIRLCVIYTSALKNSVKFADASFYLRRPPWLSLD